jgi:Na+/H+ antiporter NhaD/arsenite permease-like protein
MTEPHVVMVTPFAALLAAIALMPFVRRRWWERNYARVSIALALVVTAYYLFVLRDGARMLVSAVEYCGFIALIGSLFVIAGGIHIKMTGRSTPAANTGLLALGAILANLIGTTGAGMLLIRPLLRINRYRTAPYQVVFFIFIVCNVGGALTPIGDPPLFLGYLKGVPFFWLLAQPAVLLAWLVTVGALLMVFYLVDDANFRRHRPAAREVTRDRIELEGAHNFLWLAVIIGLVLLQKAQFLTSLDRLPVFASVGGALGWAPHKAAEGFVTLLMAGLMVAAAGLAHRFANPDALRENKFGFGPVREVAFLFLGIFATMVPALDLLEKHAGSLGLATAGQFYWSSGILSSVLDNAPTYLNFLTAAFGLHGLSLESPADVARVLGDPGLSRYVIAVSLGSVFFGAVTYIGNGPNFMVKHIAEAAGVKCPSFFGYLAKYSLPILIPIFAAVSWLFLG